MLNRSWSLPPNGGLRRRDASPVDQRRLRRCKSVSGLEMSKEMRMFSCYEENHKKRLLRLRTYAFKVRTMLEAKNNILEDLEDRFQKLTHDPLIIGPEELERRRKEMSERIIEELKCEREDQVVAALCAMQNREEEFSDKLEIARTTETLEIHRKYDEKS